TRPRASTTAASLASAPRWASARARSTPSDRWVWRSSPRPSLSSSATGRSANDERHSFYLKRCGGGLRTAPLLYENRPFRRHLRSDSLRPPAERRRSARSVSPRPHYFYSHLHPAAETRLGERRRGSAENGALGDRRQSRVRRLGYRSKASREIVHNRYAARFCRAATEGRAVFHHRHGRVSRDRPVEGLSGALRAREFHRHFAAGKPRYDEPRRHSHCR